MTTTDLETALDLKRRAGLSLYGSTARAARDRAFTPEERAALHAAVDDVRALQAELGMRRGDDEFLAALDPEPAPRPVSLGARIVQDAAFREFLRAGGHRAPGAWSIHIAAADSGATPSPSTTVVSPSIPTTFTPTPPIRRAPRVADLFAQGRTAAAGMQFMQETTGNADVPDNTPGVVQANAKPAATLALQLVTEPLHKMASVLSFPEVLLDDTPGFSTYLDARLDNALARNIDWQLMQGDGTAGSMLGLLNRTTLFPTYARADPESNAAAILTAAAKCFAASGIVPDGVAVHPLVYAYTLLMRSGTVAAATDYGAADLDAALLAPPPLYLFGLRIGFAPLTGTGIPQAVVGAFGEAAQLFYRGDLQIEITNSHVDNFVTNTLSVRAERRAALAVYYPTAFVIVGNLNYIAR
jgi:HK97 family phage major capsid protein